MNNLNPELEAQIDELTEISCQCLQGEKYPEERVKSLTEAMVRSGARRTMKLSLGEELKSRMKSACIENAMHRGAEITAIADRIESDFRQAGEWESHPKNERV